jgi:hypothetical protein
MIFLATSPFTISSGWSNSNITMELRRSGSRGARIVHPRSRARAIKSFVKKRVRSQMRSHDIQSTVSGINPWALREFPSQPLLHRHGTQILAS